jgi:hypothetical protein
MAARCHTPRSSVVGVQRLRVEGNPASEGQGRWRDAMSADTSQKEGGMSVKNVTDWQRSPMRCAFGQLPCTACHHQLDKACVVAAAAAAATAPF